MLQELQTLEGFTDVAWDVALEAVDPHVVGVAKKKPLGAERAEDNAAEGMVSRLGTGQQRGGSRKGFG